jgi:hypothetical protein
MIRKQEPLSTTAAEANHWTQFSGTEGKCIDVNQFFLALGILNMLNDFIINEAQKDDANIQDSHGHNATNC